MIGRIKAGHTMDARSSRVPPVSPAPAAAAGREHWREKPIASLPVVRTQGATTPRHHAGADLAANAASATALFVTQAIAQHLRAVASLAPDARMAAYEPRFTLAPLMTVEA